MKNNGIGFKLIAVFAFLALIFSIVFYYIPAAEKNRELKKEISLLQDKIKDLEAGKQAGSEVRLLDVSNKIAALLKDANFTELSGYVDPEQGLRFSPYSNVKPDKDVMIPASKLPGLMKDNTKYLWGNFDGSGEPINLTFREYYSKFIYDADFLNARIIGNNETIGKGNTVNNLAEVYKGAYFIEYHFPGFEAKYEGMDWKSLRLVFEKKAGKWYLLGIIHDQWTI